MRKLYIIPLFIFFSICAGYGQSAENCAMTCDSLNISLVPVNSKDLEGVKNLLHIDAYITIDSIQADTIKFGISLGMPVLELSASDIIAKGFDSKEKYQGDLPAIRTSSGFSIIKQNEIRRISVSYDIVGTYFFLYLNDSCFYKLFTFHSEYENLILKNDRMKIKNVKFSGSPPETRTFSYFDLVDTAGECFNLRGYAITTVDTTLCKYETFAADDVTYTIYAIDSVVLKNFKRYQKEYENALKRLFIYTPASNHFDIITTYWRSEKLKSAFGRAFGNYFYCDTTFISSPELLLHETIHILYPCIPQKKARGEFFIGESLTEWVARYLIDGEYKLPDNMVPADSSLFDITGNNPDTWNLIYHKGPYILQLIANEISSESLFHAIMSFWVHYRESEPQFDDFFNFLIEKGYSVSQLNKLYEL
jgi:hypothetical protein